MSNLLKSASIRISRPEGHSEYSPSTSEELAIIALDLLFKDLGYEGANQFVRQVLERYSNEPHAHAGTLAQPQQTVTE